MLSSVPGMLYMKLWAGIVRAAAVTATAKRLQAERGVHGEGCKRCNATVASLANQASPRPPALRATRHICRRLHLCFTTSPSDQLVPWGVSSA